MFYLLVREKVKGQRSKVKFSGVQVLVLQNSPLVSSCPNTGGSWDVEQFQRSSLNWFWHSDTASRAPSRRLGSRKGFLRHRFCCRRLRGSWEQTGRAGSPEEVTPSHLQDGGHFRLLSSLRTKTRTFRIFDVWRQRHKTRF